MIQRFHTFRAETLDEAYRAMRAKLGDDALVVRTATVTEGGIFGFLARKRVEITAAAPAAGERPLSLVEKRYRASEASRRAFSGVSVGSDARVQDTVAYFQKLVSEAQARIATTRGPAPYASEPQARSAAARSTDRPLNDGTAAVAPIIPFAPPKPPSQDELRRELQDLREMLQVLVTETPGTGLPPEAAPYYRALLDRGFPRQTAARLLGTVLKCNDPGLLRDPRVFRERLKMIIRQSVQVTGGLAVRPGQCRVVALAGPTGVGKTTNLAKLAALFAVRERARVGLITTDTYRVAATDQLKVYANIIGVEMKVANDPKEAAAHRRYFKDYDLVFVDTAGGSPYNGTHLEETRAMFEAIGPDETMLVLGAATPIEDLRNIVQRFSHLKPTSLLFSKLDETRRFGPLVCLTEESGIPLGYFSVGQNVPDDLVLAQTGMVAELALKGGGRRGGTSSETA